MANHRWDLDPLLEQLRDCYAKEGISDYWPAEAAIVRAALEGIDHHLPESRFTPEKVVGVGGSGVVVRLRDSLFPKVDKAIKFPRPVPGKVQLMTDMLQKEIAHLADLNHPGIVAIHYYATLDNVSGYPSLPFYLMEFVSGSRSLDFTRAVATDEAGVRHLIRGSAEVIAYLHSQPPSGFAHLDIKPDNLLVTDNGRPVVIDLGTCKRLQAGEAHTIVACTRNYARRSHKS